MPSILRSILLNIEVVISTRSSSWGLSRWGVAASQSRFPGFPELHSAYRGCCCCCCTYQWLLRITFGAGWASCNLSKIVSLSRLASSLHTHSGGAVWYTIIPWDFVCPNCSPKSCRTLIMPPFAAIMKLPWNCKIPMKWFLFIIWSQWIEWRGRHCLPSFSWMFSSCNKSMLEDRFYSERTSFLWDINSFHPLGSNTSMLSEKFHSIRIALCCFLCRYDVTIEIHKTFPRLDPWILFQHWFYRIPVYGSSCLPFILIEVNPLVLRLFDKICFQHAGTWGISCAFPFPKIFEQIDAGDIGTDMGIFHFIGEPISPS